MSKFPCCSKVVSVGRVSAQQRWGCARPIGARAPTALAAFLSSSSRWGWAEERHPLWSTASLWCCSRSWWRWRLQPSHDRFLYFSLPLADRQHAQRGHPFKPPRLFLSLEPCSVPRASLREVTPGASSSRTLQWAECSRLLCLCSGLTCVDPWKKGETEHSKGLTTGLD